MNFNKLISNNYHKLSETDIQISTFIEEHQNEMDDMSISVLSPEKRIPLILQFLYFHKNCAVQVPLNLNLRLIGQILKGIIKVLM